MAVNFPQNPSEGDTFTSGNTTFVFSNGKWTSATSPNSLVSKSGDTMTGLLTLSGDPQTNLQAATKQYIDNATEATINVKNLGAKGDGVTDDYAAITNAIAAAAGKTLVFPAGVYRISQQIFFKESNSIIRGEGDVTIKNMDGIPGNVGCAAVGNPYTATEAFNGDWKNYPPTTNVIVDNIKFDYNRERWFVESTSLDLADRWNSCCFAIGNAQYVTVKNCRMTDGKRQSIDITCPAGKYDYPDDSDDDRPGTLIELINMPSQPTDTNGDTIFAAQFVTIDDCIAEGSGDDVIATHWCSNVLIKNSLFQYTSGKGTSSNTNCIEIDDGSRNITIDNCTAFNGMGGIEVKGHPPQPSPYNIIISNTRIINCASPFENHHTDWEERVDGKLGNSWNQLLNTWYDVDASNQTKVFNWNFPNDDLSGASDIEVYFDDTNGTEVEAPSADYTITFDANQTAASIEAGNPSTSFVTFANGKAPKSTRVRIRRKFYRLSPDTEFQCYTYNGESPLARGLTYSNIQIIAPQQRWSQGSGGKKNYLGVGRAFEIGAFQEVLLENFYISDGKNDSGSLLDGYRPTQGIVTFSASNNTFFCTNHGYLIGDPVKFSYLEPNDSSTGIVEDAKNYWVKEIVDVDRFKITQDWEQVSNYYLGGSGFTSIGSVATESDLTTTYPSGVASNESILVNNPNSGPSPQYFYYSGGSWASFYDPASATTFNVQANGSAMLNFLGSGMFHIRDGVNSLSIDGVSIDGFGRIDGTYDPERVLALQALNVVSSTRGALYVNNYRSNDGPIKVIDGTGSWQYTGHISNVYAYQSNGLGITIQPINSSNKNLAFSNVTIVGYPEGRKWATNGPVTDVISERPTFDYSKNAGAGSLMTNKTTGQLLTKVSDQNDSNFLNLTACAWVHFAGNVGAGTDIGIKRQNNIKQVDKNAAGDYTVYLEDNLKFSNNNDVLVFPVSGSALGSQTYNDNPVIEADGTCSFRVTTFNASDVPNNPTSIRILVYGRPL